MLQFYLVVMSPFLLLGILAWLRSSGAWQLGPFANGHAGLGIGLVVLALLSPWIMAEISRQGGCVTDFKNTGLTVCESLPDSVGVWLFYAAPITFTVFYAFAFVTVLPALLCYALAEWRTRGAR